MDCYRYANKLIISLMKYGAVFKYSSMRGCRVILGPIVADTLCYSEIPFTLLVWRSGRLHVQRSESAVKTIASGTEVISRWCLYIVCNIIVTAYS
jgi:hypothetical protein